MVWLRTILGAQTIAMSQSPLCRLSQASLSAVKEDEHAVSTAKLGPVRLRQNEILFANIDAVIPVDENWSILL